MNIQKNDKKCKAIGTDELIYLRKKTPSFKQLDKTVINLEQLKEKCGKNTLKQDIGSSRIDDEVEKIKDLNLTNECNVTILMRACRKGYLALVISLIRHGADVSVFDINNNIALVYAIKSFEIKLIELLLKIEYPPEVFQKFKYSAAMELAENRMKQMSLEKKKCTEIMCILINYAKKWILDKNELLNYMAKFNCLDELEALIDQKVHINKVDEFGKTALEYAVERGNLDAAELLLRYNANPNIVYGEKIYNSITPEIKEILIKYIQIFKMKVEFKLLKKKAY